MRIDNIGFGGLQIYQEPEEFCYGVDAVILADFAASCKPRTAIDLGTGSGIIPLILSHKTDAEKILGLELQRPSYERASQSVILNELRDRIEIIHGDVADKNLRSFLLDRAGAKDGVDLVTSNPPYMAGDGAITNKNQAKAIARHETTAKLEDFVETASKLLKDKGHFYMVHRPSRLVDIFCALRKHNLEPKEMRLVCPREGEAPNIVLVHSVKNAGPELKMLEELNVHDLGDGYTEEIEKIYERI